MCGFIGILSKKQTRKKLFYTGFETILARVKTSDVVQFRDESYGYSRLTTDNDDNEQLATIIRYKGSIFLFNGLLTNTNELQEPYQLPLSLGESDGMCLREGLMTHGVR